jgi:hypothetical protein
VRGQEAVRARRFATKISQGDAEPGFVPLQDYGDSADRQRRRKEAKAANRRRKKIKKAKT